MSAYGPKRTSLVAPHMSAFEGKADITIAPQNVRCRPMLSKKDFEGGLRAILIQNLFQTRKIDSKSQHRGFNYLRAAVVPPTFSTASTHSRRLTPLVESQSSAWTNELVNC